MSDYDKSLHKHDKKTEDGVTESSVWRGASSDDCEKQAAREQTWRVAADRSKYVRQRPEKQMDVWGWVKLNERKKSEELWELLGLETVSLMIKKSRLRWFGHVEWKDDNDWVKHCIMWEVEGIREDARKRPGGIVLRMTWKV